jgi:anti-sigma B factor antagonist
VLVDVLVTSRDGWVVIAPVGDLDLAAAPQVRGEAVRQVTDGNSHLVLDLSGVEFVDSTGLGVVVAAAKRARSAGGDVRLCGVSGPVAKVFEVVGLERIFEVFDDVAAAVAG